MFLFNNYVDKNDSTKVKIKNGKNKAIAVSHNTHTACDAIFSISYQLNQAAGSTLLRLSVSDKDSPRNGPPFEFRIMSGNEENFFSMDQSGTLRSNRVLGPDLPREFTLEIQVKSKIES